MQATWQVYHTCVSLRAQYRASKIMRSEAEASLRHLTLTLFSRVHVILHDEPITVSEVVSEQHILISSPNGIQLVTTKILTVDHTYIALSSNFHLSRCWQP